MSVSRLGLPVEASSHTQMVSDYRSLCTAMTRAGLIRNCVGNETFRSEGRYSASPNCEVDHLGRDEGTIMSELDMSELEQRAKAETLFERGQSREQIKDALRLEEERRA